MTGRKMVHWADMTADRIIKQCGDKKKYVLAAGITPSGTVHFGNFREAITVDFVAQALKDAGKEVRFIFSWDDYDTFRKIPKNMPKQEELKKYLYYPIVDTPDPYEEQESYAAHHEKKFEAELARVHIQAECLYQAKKYRQGDYAELLIKTMKAKETCAQVLNAHRSTPLPGDWWPLSVYCEKCHTDHKTKVTQFDGEQTIQYECQNCSHQGKLDLKNTKNVKLPWRLDWPMRWSFEQVDFEPGGKDHSSQGGSYTTAKELVGKVYGFRPPAYLQYDFVSIKGRGGKMSSSSGDVITVSDVLDIYPPEMVRWIFASYKSNIDFAVSFDLDVIKTYEDFDRQERLAFGLEEGNEKKTLMAKRVMELSYRGELPAKAPFRPSFRHLTNILQIFEGDIEMALEYFSAELKDQNDQAAFKLRAQCAKNWLNLYAPEDFKFQVNQKAPVVEMNDGQKLYVKNLKDVLEGQWESMPTDKELHEKMYELIHEQELAPSDVFPVLYQLLISKEKGPKLAGFIRTLGKDRVVQLLS